MSGILVGIKHITPHKASTTVWYRANGINRNPRTGAMQVFGRDDNRTIRNVPMRLFCGVTTIDAMHNKNPERYPEIAEWEVMA